MCRLICSKTCSILFQSILPAKVVFSFYNPNGSKLIIGFVKDMQLSFSINMNSFKVLVHYFAKFLKVTKPPVLKVFV